ncbi:putative nucleotidyltransferase [Scopulibacillus daqui]|uniref:tRNA(Met) cytidine acetate ligase n=1 Tax=Scopulibacillus daqui TaxID=1469162 RepID=A0ABS2PWE1_9BACL|nr:nucleotidyltransferase [Scopulibacillus daqui]MBM7644246.1 putative nucleotidyltransferase [Scopulibacillus daqui]
MKAAGVIVEYNPLHNGHLHHIQKTREQTQADVLIAVMSGYFLQRGEPALVSKWLRTKFALLAGIDIIIELPYAFSTQKAEIFANGAVSILGALDVSDICFGSEQGEITPFENTVALIDQLGDQYNHQLKTYLKEGYSYPKAHALSFQTLAPSAASLVDLSQPNNILGYHYLKSVKDQSLPIKVSTIKRIGAGYHDMYMNKGNIASATSIRKAIFEQQSIDEAARAIPSSTYLHLKTAFERRQIYRWDDFFPFLKYRLSTENAESLSSIYETEEGLEHRMIKIIREANHFNSFMEKLKTKRYTWTRLQRLCTHVLVNAKKTEMMQALEEKKAPYIRLLGINQNGQAYLNKIKSQCPLPIITKQIKDSSPLMTLDTKAAKVYELAGLNRRDYKIISNEITQPPLRYDEFNQNFLLDII